MPLFNSVATYIDHTVTRTERLETLGEILGWPTAFCNSEVLGDLIDAQVENNETDQAVIRQLKKL